MKALHAIPLIAISLSYSVAQAEVDIEFTSLCIEDKSTGFAWEDGRWEQTNFIVDKYLVTKLDMNKPKSKMNVYLCILNYENYKKSKDFESKHRSQGCYNIRDFGTTMSARGANWCQESSKEQADNTWEIRTVVCDSTYTSAQFRFHPDGIFHRAYIDRDLRATMPGVYSMVISVGTCSRIE
jgi:hypothetical protein